RKFPLQSQPDLLGQPCETSSVCLTAFQPAICGGCLSRRDFCGPGQGFCDLSCLPAGAIFLAFHTTTCWLLSRLIPLTICHEASDPKSVFSGLTSAESDCSAATCANPARRQAFSGN